MSQPGLTTDKKSNYDGEGVMVTYDANPSLKEFLFEHNVSNEVYYKLEQAGIDWNTLLHIELTELDILCGKQVLNLPFMVKIKFKAAIKQLQLLYKHRNQSQQHQHIITITTEEQKYLDLITTQLKQANNIQTLFENHFNQVEDYCVNIKSNIDAEFENIIQKLQQRKQSLQNKVENLIYLCITDCIPYQIFY